MENDHPSRSPSQTGTGLGTGPTAQSNNLQQIPYLQRTFFESRFSGFHFLLPGLLHNPQSRKVFEALTTTSWAGLLDSSLLHLTTPPYFLRWLQVFFLLFSRAPYSCCLDGVLLGLSNGDRWPWPGHDGHGVAQAPWRKSGEKKTHRSPSIGWDSHNGVWSCPV